MLIIQTYKVIPNTQSTHFCGVWKGDWYAILTLIFVGEANSQTPTCNLSLFVEGIWHHTKAQPLNNINLAKKKIKMIPRNSCTSPQTNDFPNIRWKWNSLPKKHMNIRIYIYNDNNNKKNDTSQYQVIIS